MDQVSQPYAGDQVSYEDQLPGLPYPEVPVVTLTALPSRGGHLLIHLHPAECPSLLAMMRAIVVGFTVRFSSPERKTRSAASLANYDIARLEAWHRARDDRPNLVVFLHDFEQFDVGVVQDAFYICRYTRSLACTARPLVFVLGLTSPSTPTHLHKAYSRSTLALLAFEHSVHPPTFFDPAFEPDVMIGPATLDFLHDFTSRHTASLDALYTILQRSGSLNTDADALAASPDELLGAVNAARVTFRHRARQLRFAAALRGRVEKDVRYLGMVVKKLSAAQLLALLEELLALFERGDEGGAGAEEESPQARIQGFLAQLARTQEDEEMGADTDAPVQQALTITELAVVTGDWLVQFLEQRFVRLDEGALWDVWYMGNTPFPAELINPAPRLGVVSALLHPDDFVHAHAELLLMHDARAPAPPAPNPAPELDLDFALEEEGESGGASENAPALWQLPDTSILFRRYAEAGRMVNVYDWFQSFAVVLEDQRRQLRRLDAAEERAREEGGRGRAGLNGRGNGGGARARKGKGRGRGGQRAALQMEVEGDSESGREDSAGEEESEEEESEEWREEVLARFMRALHTLDYMGFVRHTGRKADHIMRTTYDVLD
ncbi:uncharacterized protein B0H18DRAFT_1171539 [Fomitopsis serialis]|uniref:uncharacterized protein n=1 Tax=Fomitopsis serialis TaxID=139415 RepID=UPI00200722E1|nr:uncharacterized protein B0H18DRAFT_1171539 [Neoantrodia serialis]KAH9925151.1 hypothetical protein B0H18DRAFT_1171539 [Neoantrodia serialis]